LDQLHSSFSAQRRVDNARRYHQHAALQSAPDRSRRWAGYSTSTDDIIQNAIDLHQGLGLGESRIAILSAVEPVTSKIPGTIGAAALCKMADRGQITGGMLLTSRADSVRTRMASCAIAALYAHSRRPGVALAAE
jgi:hypothetical protein